MLEHLHPKTAASQRESRQRPAQNHTERDPKAASYYAPCTVAQRIKGLLQGDLVTLSISFDFDFMGRIEEIIDDNNYKIRPVGTYTEENEAAFQDKVGISMKPSFSVPQKWVIPVKRAERRSNILILRNDPNKAAISKSVMENGLLVSSESAAKGIPGKDAFSDGKLSVNVFTAQALSGAGAKENIHTLFYEAAGGVFPISIERKDNPVREIVASDIMREEEMPKLTYPQIFERVAKFIAKELNDRKPMFEYYAAKNMLIIGTYPFSHDVSKADSAHEERLQERIASDCFEYVFYTKEFANCVDRSVRPGLLYREVAGVVKKTIVIPIHYFFNTSDARIIRVFSSMSTFKLEISVPDYEGSLKNEELLSDKIYFSHVVRL